MECKYTLLEMLFSDLRLFFLSFSIIHASVQTEIQRPCVFNLQHFEDARACPCVSPNSHPIIIPIDASLDPPDHLVFAPFICGPTPQVANGVPSIEEQNRPIEKQ